MQYKVPQNVQREDTIIGPITFKQLIILFAGGGLTYVIYSILARKFFIEIWLGPVIIGSSLTLAFAFLKINEREFHIYLLNLLAHTLTPKKRLWRKGSGDTFISPFSKIYVKKPKKVEPVKKEGPKNLDKIIQILDKPIKK
ncbi:MAG: PrgI family protein [Candidatus Gracilibacteria bacterium]|jgi:hypothetical protein|nr:PrgI family protein [Candidatus Gracilibacteria bacterium]